MKTATVPNSPELTTLMKLNAELSVVLEDYEVHCREQMVSGMLDATTNAVNVIKDKIPEITDDHVRLIRAVISEAVGKACESQASYVTIHEHTLGLTSGNAPGEQAKRAVNIYAHQSQVYWEQV